jgi:hypothetical protein
MTRGFRILRLTLASLTWLVAATSDSALAQQYNSDSYLSKPHGMATIILTAGERNLMWMMTFSLFPRWEFTSAAYVYNNDDDLTTDDGYSTSYYAKYMFYENKAKTGGFAIKAGTGLDPGLLEEELGPKDAFQTYWTNAPATIPLFHNKLSWDIMPGASLTRKFGSGDKPAGAFTYSTRLAWYVFNPESAIVGEVFGAEGGTTAIPEYRIGWRWEPSRHVVLALTYVDEFIVDNGAGLEVGLMLFTPPFLKL